MPNMRDHLMRMAHQCRVWTSYDGKGSRAGRLVFMAGVCTDVYKSQEGIQAIRNSAALRILRAAKAT